MNSYLFLIDDFILLAFYTLLIQTAAKQQEVSGDGSFIV